MKTFPKTITIEGRDIPFELNRLSLRKKNEMLGLMESIVKKTEGANVYEKIESGLQMCVSSWDGGRPIPEIMDEIIEADDAMKIIQETMRGNQITEDERKKSE